MVKVNTYLNFNGNTEEAFNFYKSVFGGEFSYFVRFNEMPMEGVQLSEEDRNKLMHVSLPVGEHFVLMGTDTLESLGQQLVQGNNLYLSIHPDSKDEADRIFNALSEGAEIEMPMADQVWGDYFGSLKDKFGTGWMVNYGQPQDASGSPT